MKDQEDWHETLFTAFCLLPAPLLVAWMAIQTLIDYLT